MKNSMLSDVASSEVINPVELDVREDQIMQDDDLNMPSGANIKILRLIPNG